MDITITLNSYPLHVEGITGDGANEKLLMVDVMRVCWVDKRKSHLF